MLYIAITALVWLVCFYIPGLVFLRVFAEERRWSTLAFTVAFLVMIVPLDLVYNPTLNSKFLIPLLFTLFVSLAVAAICSIVAEVLLEVVPSRPIRSYRVRVAVPAAVLVVLIFTYLVSFPGFHTESVKNLVKIEEAKVLSAVEPKRVRLVPKPTAIAVADKILGSYKTDDGVVLGSMVQIDDSHATVQSINGTLYWVVPLKYTGFFKQLRLGPIPGFILVDAYDINKPPQLLQTNPVTGKAYRLNCSMGGYFERNAQRILRATHVTKRLIDFSFEVSDEWEPYVVATVVEPAIVFSKPYKVKGVATLNLETCEVRDFALGEIPGWIDRVVPEGVAVDTLNTVGKWSHGFFSGIFTKAYNWVVTNGGMSFVQDGSNRTFWVSAITSAGNDQSAIGIVEVDTKTMQVVKQKLTGPTEDGVISRVTASLGVNADVWSVYKPLLYRIYGKLVWVAVVIDDATHLPTKYAVVDAHDVRKIEIDDDFFRAVERFFTGAMTLDLVKEVVSWSGTVVRSTVTAGVAYILDAAGRVWKCIVRELPICAFVRDGDRVDVQGIELVKGKVVRVNKIADVTLEKAVGANRTGE